MARIRRIKPSPALRWIMAIWVSVSIAGLAFTVYLGSHPASYCKELWVTAVCGDDRVTLFYFSVIISGYCVMIAARPFLHLSAMRFLLKRKNRP